MATRSSSQDASDRRVLAVPDWLRRLVRGGGRERPWNVLWICADDFPAYVSGTYGNPLAETPCIDRLAGEGIRFDRAYCACPLSTPSRMAFLTGRYPRSVGVTLTPTPLPPGEVTIGSLLRARGYEAVAIGKTHYYSPLTHEFDRLIDDAEYEDYLHAHPPAPIPPGVRVLGPWRPFRDPVAVWLNAGCLPFARDSAMSGTFLAREAARFLGEHHARPFFLSVGFYEVHSPFRFPVEFAGRFDPARFVAPEVTPGDRDQVPDVFRPLSDAEKRGIAAACYTSVAYMDRNVGTILDALDRSPYAGNTLVIFNADHGALLGQHGRFEKHCSYEEAVRAALVLRLPGVVAPGRSTTALVELIDLVPTVLDLVGAPTPPNIQGRSLLPLLTGATTQHRDHVIVEYADNAEAMVRTARWKLIVTAGNRQRRDGYARAGSPPAASTRLFDLDADAAEVHDRAADPANAPVIARLLATLIDHLRATDRHPETLPPPGDVPTFLAGALPPTDGW